ATRIRSSRVATRRILCAHRPHQSASSPCGALNRRVPWLRPSGIGAPPPTSGRPGRRRTPGRTICSTYMSVPHEDLGYTVAQFLEPRTRDRAGLLAQARVEFDEAHLVVL